MHALSASMRRNTSLVLWATHDRSGHLTASLDYDARVMQAMTRQSMTLRLPCPKYLQCAKSSMCLDPDMTGAELYDFVCK